jgi:hypothetical protein
MPLHSSTVIISSNLKAGSKTRGIIFAVLLTILGNAGFSQTTMKDLVKEGTKFTYSFQFQNQTDTFSYKIKKMSPDLVVNYSFKEMNKEYTISWNSFINSDSIWFMPGGKTDMVPGSAIFLFLSRRLYTSLLNKGKIPVPVNILIRDSENLGIINFTPEISNNGNIDILVNGKLISFARCHRMEAETSNSNDYLSILEFIEDFDFPVINRIEYSPAHMAEFAPKWKLIAVDN